MVPKLALIGGSSINTPELFECLHERGLPVGEVCLIGRSAEKRETVAAFSRRLCDELGYRTRITTAAEVSAGLRDASHIINQIKVGGSNVWHRCQHVLRSFGIEGHALNYGGALSNLNVVLNLARTILEVCPDAWLIEFTNPCGIHAEAFARCTPELKVITGCNVPLRALETAAELLGKEVDTSRVPSGRGGVEITWFGFNHCAWVQDVLLDGQVVTEEVMARNAAREPPKWRADLIEQFGVIPVADAARLFDKPQPPPGDDTAKARDFADNDAERDAAALAAYNDLSLRPGEALRRKRRANWYQSCIVSILEGLTTGEPRRYYCARPTREALPDFPGRTVECAVTLSPDSATPLPLKPLTPPIRALCELLRASEELLIEAAVTRRKRHAVEALAIHPMCPSLRQAQRAVDFLVAEVGVELTG